MVPISVCIITKNESQKLHKCLSCIKNYPFELIVVDTGSTDDSVEVAKSFTEHVYHFDWISDFSAARNFSISKASHDWIMVLDTDEYVINLDLDAIYHFAEEHPKSIGRMTRHSMSMSGAVFTDEAERFFSKQYYHYERPIHEQVRPIGEIPLTYYPIAIELDHDGYVGTQDYVEAKTKRDLTILLDNLDSYTDPYSFFQIGQCYYILQNYDEAIVYYEKALTYDLNPNEEAVKMLIVNYGYSLIHAKHAEEAVQIFESIYDEFKEYADFVYLMGQMYTETGHYLKAASQFILATTLTDYQMEGANSYRSWYRLGIIYEMIDNVEMAKTFYEKSGDFEPAKERLEAITK